MKIYQFWTGYASSYYVVAENLDEAIKEFIEYYGDGESSMDDVEIYETELKKGVLAHMDWTEPEGDFMDGVKVYPRE